MRLVYAILTVLAIAVTAVDGELLSLNRSVPDSAASTSNIILARMGAIPGFSTGSASPLQRNLSAESQATQANTIYYSSLSLTGTNFIQPPGDGGFGLTNPGDNGVVTGGGGDGSGLGGAEPITAVPSPGAASLGIIGVTAIGLLRRRGPRPQ